jgi:hypothetical protein
VRQERHDQSVPLPLGTSEGAELQEFATDIITANITLGEKVRTGAPPDDVQKPEENQPRTALPVSAWKGRSPTPNTHLGRAIASFSRALLRALLRDVSVCRTVRLYLLILYTNGSYEASVIGNSDAFSTVEVPYSLETFYEYVMKIGMWLCRCGKEQSTLDRNTNTALENTMENTTNIYNIGYVPQPPTFWTSHRLT